MKMKCMQIPKDFKHERLLSRVIVDQKTECWNWTGYSHGGYGKMSIGEKDYQAHRLSYDLFHGIKENHTVIDHKCMNKLCINPDHLREVTVRTNTLENSKCDAVFKKSQSHCLNGHEFTQGNTTISYGVYGGERRNCRTCAIETKKQWYIKNKLARKDKTKQYYKDNCETIKARSRDRYKRISQDV